MSYVIVATYRAQEGHADEVADHLRQMMMPTREEPGCISYDVHRSRQDSAVFVLVEDYRDEDAFTAHTEAHHFQTHIRNGAIPLLADRTVERLAPLT
jgi:quinol monooxygenase YgiN